MNIFPPVTERSVLPPWFVPCFHAFIVVSLALSPGPFRVAVTLPFLTFLMWMYGQYKVGGSFSDNYPISCFVTAGVMKYVDFVLLSNADRDRFRPLKSSLPSTKASLRGTEQPNFFLSRLSWSWNITTVCPRGFGWTHQVKNIPASSPMPPKWKFVLCQVLKGLLALLVLDTVKSFVISTAAGAIKGAPLDPSGYDSEPLWKQLILSLCAVLWTWAPFTLQACSIYAVTVGLGIYRPEDCPPAWGSWTESYTVRNLWGKTWHQFLRRTTNMAGDFVARDSLHLRRGTWLSNYTKLFAGFLASALLHSAAAMYSCGHDTGDFVAFMSQAVVILLEDHVIAAARKLGFRDRKAWRAVGYVWTWAWLLFSWRWWVGPQLREGLGVFPKTVDVFGLIPSQSMVGGGAGGGHGLVDNSSLRTNTSEL